jgi:anti-sigma regulatory factor (Ser/Thr protein kinase)
MSGEIDSPWVRLELTSRPEAARLVRSMSSAAGEALGFDPELLADVNTGVTEACNNVIVHAYPDRVGPMAVELTGRPQGVQARIIDQGCGIHEAAPDQDGLKVGFALMAAVAERAEFINVPDGGTEVRLSFRAPAGDPTAAWPTRHAASAGSAAWQAELHSGLTGDVVLTVSPVALLAPVLGRISRALAPSAGFSLQRCSDVYTVSDALAAQAEQAADSTSISVALGARQHRLDFALAPLRMGTSAEWQQTESRQRPGTLTALGEELAFVARDGHETLRLSMIDHLRA